jgi:hypothetical protein
LETILQRPDAKILGPNSIPWSRLVEKFLLSITIDVSFFNLLVS